MHYSISGTVERADGRWESPHIAFPVNEGMDRVVATLPGEEPPPLGQEIFEDAASIKLRKKTPIDFKVGVTYTFAQYSAYADFLEWKVLNLPGIRPFSISSLVGPQPMFMTLYELRPGEGDKGREKDVKRRHYHRDRKNIVRLEVANSAQSRVGPATRTWLHSQASQASASDAIARIEKQVQAADEEADGLDSDEESEDDNESTDSLLQTELSRIAGFDDGYQSEGAAEELGEGIYVRSGDTVSLRELLAEEDILRAQPTCHLANGGGFAVLQEQSSATIIIEKAGRSRVRKKGRASSRLIKSGDTVRAFGFDAQQFAFGSPVHPFSNFLLPSH